MSLKKKKEKPIIDQSGWAWMSIPEKLLVITFTLVFAYIVYYVLLQ